MAPQKKYYTVGVSNKFSAFADNASEGGDSSGEDEVILAAPPPSKVDVEEEKPKDITSGNVQKKTPSGRKAAAQEGERRPRPSGQGREGGHPNGGFGGRGAYRGGYRGGAPRGVGGEEKETRDEMVQDGYAGFNRRGNYPRYRTRGRQGPHDRHTAAANGGRDPKKGGGGAHNWGDGNAGPADELKAEQVEGEEKKIEATEGEEQDAEKTEAEKKEEDVIDLEAYKKMLADKRQNLPSFVNSKANKKVLTDKELEAQGYKINHTKEGARVETRGEETSEDEEDGEPKKKTMNVFEYIHNGGGRVNLFPNRRRGRGGAGTGGSRGEYRGRGNSFVKSRDAPDIQDKRAFPSLGGM